MRILGIETSGYLSQVALAEGQRLTNRWEDSIGRRHARELVPGIQRLLTEAAWKPDDLDLIAVSIGPGSYTGLRIGVTCAKTLAYATRAEVLGVGTPETIAQNAPREAQRVSVVIDAQRGQVYATEFQRDANSELKGSVQGTLIVPAEDWAKGLKRGAYVLGPALTRFRDLPEGNCRIGDEVEWKPKVEAMIQLAGRDFLAGRRMDLHALEPLYLRKSAAEEKWDASH